MLTPSIGKNTNVPPAVFVTRGFCGEHQIASDAVRAVEHGELNGDRQCSPFSAAAAQVSTAERAMRTGDRRPLIQPQCLVVVFHRPVNGIAGQAVLAGQRLNVPAFQPAEAALRRSPECAIRTEPKIQDLAGAKAIFCRCATLSRSPERARPRLCRKSQMPPAARVRDRHHSVVCMTERRPGNLLHRFVAHSNVARAAG